MIGKGQELKENEMHKAFVSPKVVSKATGGTGVEVLKKKGRIYTLKPNDL